MSKEEEKGDEAMSAVLELGPVVQQQHTSVRKSSKKKEKRDEQSTSDSSFQKECSKICRSWCFEPGFPLTIDPQYKTLVLAKWIKYEYTRFRQADDFFKYWPTITAFVLGVLGAIQSYVSDRDNSLAIAKGFGLAQAIAGLAVTFAAGIAGSRRDVAQKRLKNYIVDAMTKTPRFFVDPELTTPVAVFQRIGLKDTAEH